ncbi:MAG: hypothetical protein J6C31_05590 [Prevotella sp.]|nr:hypothetical protein [Prevotella sp.]
MEKETQRKNQKSVIKNVLIGVGIVAASALTVSVIMLKIKQQNYRKDMLNAYKPTLKTTIAPPKKKKHKVDAKEDAVVRKCNKLLNTLWKSGNPDSKLYYDDEIYIDIKACPFPPYITH